MLFCPFLNQSRGLRVGLLPLILSACAYPDQVTSFNEAFLVSLGPLRVSRGGNQCRVGVPSSFIGEGDDVLDGGVPVTDGFKARPRS